jgi:hypothetical protein
VRGLSWRDRALAIEAVVLITCAAPLLRLVGLRRLTAAMRHRSAAANTTNDLERTRTIARIVAMAARHTPLSNTCLHRSLTLWWLLGRRGLPGDLVVGARKHHGDLAAHAWVEYRGAVVNDDADAVTGYVVLARTPYA